ncbi:imidazole glycerol phosphate synthase subunit HisH [Alphaproteobacteria bacterium]|nr:imidazole glycerol phosphate synthase subunit HisH [Alphaproteobacteria bacterium]
MTTTIGIIDFGLCNLDSIARAVERCGARVIVANIPSEISTCDRLILPGVGAFATATENLHRAGMDKALVELHAMKKLPILGICLGMHLLADTSMEGGISKGLGLLPGNVERLAKTREEERIPHIGWNDVETQRLDPLFENIATGTDFYFVHGYKFVPTVNVEVLAVTDYCGGFTAAAKASGNVYGVQFHPEKSMAPGLKLLANFIQLQC